MEENRQVNMIEQAEQAAAKLREEREKMDATIKQMQEIQTRNILGGQSFAGEPPKPEVKESPIEYAKRILRGEL